VAGDDLVKEPREDPDTTIVRDPVPVTYALRYTEGLTASPLQILARTAEELVDELSEDA
jgi:hypothetical protein